MKSAKPSNCRLTSGFTLLEMMLAIGLIALTAMFVSLNIGQSNSRIAKLEAKRFVALVNLAQDESILTGRAIKLEVDAKAHQYQFKPVVTESWFQPSQEQTLGEDDQSNSRSSIDVESEEPSKDAEPDEPSGDYFHKIRHIPQEVQLSFDLEPQKKQNGSASKFVAKRVHEILNESILNAASDRFSDEEESGVLIEPNGLISPFSFRLSQNDTTTVVELDRYGKAAIKNAKP